MSLADEPRPLQRGYYRRVEVALVIAAGFHAAVFMLAPPYVPRPYRLREPPLKLVTAAVVGIGEADAPAAATSSPPAPAPPPRAAAFVSEQLLRAQSGEASPGSGAARPGAGGGSGDVEPPVFYAFDTAPTAVRRVVPEYPASARAQGAQGTVILNANIDERGRILRVWVARATAPEVLIQAAIDAIYQFEFSPGSAHGQPVKCTVAVPFEFHLNTSM